MYTLVAAQIQPFVPFPLLKVTSTALRRRSEWTWFGQSRRSRPDKACGGGNMQQGCHCAEHPALFAGRASADPPPVTMQQGQQQLCRTRRKLQPSVVQR